MSNRKGLILFVDEEYYVLETLRKIFRREFDDYRMEFAQSGEEALELLAEMDEDQLAELIVFSDWHMPTMLGDELLSKIHDKYPHSINFLLSGVVNQDQIREISQNPGITRVLEKPWENHNLVRILNDIISR